MSIIKVVRLAAALVVATTAAQAAVFSFDTDPFAGSTALTTPGRQVVANEQFIPQFDFAADVISVNAGVFNISPTVSFFNGFASSLPAGEVNVVVLQDIDADGNPGNGNLLNAGLAANLVASGISQPGAGFFVYFNTALSLNRLVFSTDLDSPTADLKIIARFQDQSGQAGINALQQYSASNFAVAVPEPASAALMLAGLAGLIARRRKGSIATVSRQAACGYAKISG